MLEDSDDDDDMIELPGLSRSTYRYFRWDKVCMASRVLTAKLLILVGIFPELSQLHKRLFRTTTCYLGGWE